MRHLLDNGAYTLKFGLETEDPVQFQNCISSIKREVQVAPKNLVNTTEILRPFDRGILIDPELQLKIWKSCLAPEVSTLIYTSPLYTPTTSRHSLDELIYEDLQISSAARVPTGLKSQCLLVDLGFSCITITPIYKGFPINYAVIRCQIGGKLITNYMKEQISYRYFDMTEETWLVNHIREQTCRVSQNFIKDLRDLQYHLYRHKKARETVYVLPENNDAGYVLEEGASYGNRQVMSMSNLTISVPELLFRPSDAGIHCGGVHEGIVESVSRLPKDLGTQLLKNVIVTGGLAKTPGLVQRIQREVAENVDCEVSVQSSNNEIFACWESLKSVNSLISKKDYEEMGSYYIDSIGHYP